MAQLKHATDPEHDETANVSGAGYQTGTPGSKPVTPGNGCLEGAVRRMRRVSVTVERREVSVSITHTVETRGRNTGYAPGPSGASGPSGPWPPATPPAGRPEVCPDCGANYVSAFEDILNGHSDALAQLQAAILDERLHAYWMTEGQFWVCERSIRLIREDD